MCDKPLNIEGIVELLITIREGCATRTLTINFMAIDCTSTYNCIIGQSFIYATR